MFDWIAVTLAGVLGGIVDVILSGEPLLPYREGDERCRINYTALGSVVLGAAAGFLFWAFTVQPLDFSSTRLVPGRIGISMVAGAGGAQLLRDYITRLASGRLLAEAGRMLQED